VCTVYFLDREIFQGKADGNSVKRLVESDSDEDNDPCKKGEGLRVQPTSQEVSTTSAVVKTGSKRPQPDNVSVCVRMCARAVCVCTIKIYY